LETTMHVGYAVNFQNPGQARSDAEVYREDVRLARLAEPLGFDSVWAIEHHFTDYIMIPDPVQFLSYMAGCTSRVQLGTMVVVLPWHDPLRVAEELSMLDHLCDGRLIFGMGRGAGRVEFERFRLDMGESRERFVEAADMVLKALDSGFMEYDGRFYKQPRAAIRPKPAKPFKGRTYAAAVSPESARIMAKLGVGILVIPQKPWPEVEKEMAEYRRIFQEVNGAPAPQPVTSGWVFCDKDAARAEEQAIRWIGGYYQTVLDHYEFAGDHMKTTKGYEYYGKFADRLQRHGKEEFVRFFCDLQIYGTPEQCYEKIMNVQQRLNGCAFNGVFSYAGMPWDEAERNLRLFAAEVMPELQKVDVGAEPDMAGRALRQAAE